LWHEWGTRERSAKRCRSEHVEFSGTAAAVSTEQEQKKVAAIGHRGLRSHALIHRQESGRHLRPASSGFGGCLGRRRCPLWAISGHSVVHSMTSSARNNSDAGTDTPKTSALRKFRTNSNLVGRSIGRSAGLAPRSTFPERTPARLYSPRRFGP